MYIHILGPCPPGKNDKCIYLYGTSYIFEKDQRTWEEAKYHCQNENGSLANLADDSLLKQLVKSRTKYQKSQYSYWIGLTRIQWVIQYGNGKFETLKLIITSWLKRICSLH